MVQKVLANLTLTLLRFLQKAFSVKKCFLSRFGNNHHLVGIVTVSIALRHFVG
jgi:hypothetical protein